MVNKNKTNGYELKNKKQVWEKTEKTILILVFKKIPGLETSAYFLKFIKF